MSENGDKYDIALRNNNNQLIVKVGKDNNGKRSIQIGQNKPQLYSKITSKYLPYYPTSEVSTELIDNGYSRVDTITIVGWLKDMPEDERAAGAFEIFYNYNFPKFCQERNWNN